MTPFLVRKWPVWCWWRKTRPGTSKVRQCCVAQLGVGGTSKVRQCCVAQLGVGGTSKVRQCCVAQLGVGGEPWGHMEVCGQSAGHQGHAGTDVDKLPPWYIKYWYTALTCQSLTPASTGELDSNTCGPLALIRGLVEMLSGIVGGLSLCQWWTFKLRFMADNDWWS